MSKLLFAHFCQQKHSEAMFLPISKKVCSLQSDSRLRQLHEINSCEQLNEMEEYLRIDCFASANSFVLCFNFDKRNTEKQWPKCSNGSQTHSPLNSIRNSLVDKNYTCSRIANAAHSYTQFIRHTAPKSDWLDFLSQIQTITVSAHVNTIAIAIGWNWNAADWNRFERNLFDELLIRSIFKSREGKKTEFQSIL